MVPPFLMVDRVMIADIAEHAAEAAILLHVFADVFRGEHQGYGRHGFHLHHVLRVAAQVFVSPAGFANHVDGVWLAGRAGSYFLGEKDTAIDLEGKGVEVEDGDGLVGFGLFEQALDFGIALDGPALARIAKLAGILAPATLLHWRAAFLV